MWLIQKGSLTEQTVEMPVKGIPPVYNLLAVPPCRGASHRESMIFVHMVTKRVLGSTVTKYVCVTDRTVKVLLCSEISREVVSTMDIEPAYLGLQL